ncbi:MAG: GAF domain-containing protein [Nitrospira sp.]|nr:MAG: GAF domain-containing protein [Nitrospira sp.]
MAQDATTLDDPKRLDALHAYETLDTLPDPAFDRLAKLAAQICGTPYAAITFVVREQTFYKSKVGFTDGDAPGVLGFCQHGTLHTDLFIVPDAMQDERFASNQMVIGDAQVRFYAGMPLITAEGHALGMLCVLDRVPRQLTKEQGDALRVLAHEVLTELELRRTRKSLEEGTFRQDPVLGARYKADEFLRSLVEGTVASTGGDFLRELVKHVAAALGLRYAFVGYLLPESRIRTLAFWKGDGYLDQMEYSLDGTPCTKVIQGETCHYAQDVQKLFPRDQDLVTLDVTSYLAVPLKNPKGQVLGHLVAMDVKPMTLTSDEIEVFKLFGERAGVEIYRQVIETALKEREATLRAIAEGTASEVGANFFRSLVKSLATALGVDYAYISELGDDGQIFRSRAGWGKGQPLPPFDVPARGPCETVLKRNCVHHPSKLRELYPHVQLIQAIGVESYCGVPVISTVGSVLGHLAVMDCGLMLDKELVLSVLGIFSTRAAAEFERLRYEETMQRSNQTLRAIFEGTAPAVGEGFFHLLVKNLAKALDIEYAFVSEFCVDRTKVRTLAFWAGDRLKDNFEYTIAGTPCEQVLAGELYHCADKVADRFPLHSEDLEKLGVQSYLAIPVTSVGGLVLGHLAVMDRKPMALERMDLSVFKIFGARAGAELERMHMEIALKDNEERLRDLFDEAPIAYVYEGVDSKLLRVNRTAMKSLGITADQVEGLYGRDFVPDTPDAQRRLKEAFASVGKGIDTSGVVLELRRKDDGKPLWMKWWSRPDPGGTYTRTMFIDITEQVLMEQEKARLEAQNIYLQEEIKVTHNFEELIGGSTSLKKVLKNVERVAQTDSTVLITGETGTGKELIARAIHNLSLRKGRPLVKVNCAAIPAGLIESELFGHEKGAFTGALTKKMGRFELADKGTIFLDEIGELPLDLQSKLLRVLQEGEFERVGGTQTFKVSVRVIAATNRDLEHLSKTGHYRPDLYYRLNVFPIHLPALRERADDIPLLVQYFVRKFAANLGKKIDRIPERMMTALQRYPWPGNIRELEHVIERAVILSEGPELEPIDWLSQSGSKTASGKTLTLEEMERQHIVDVLEQTNWRVSGEKGAAKILGLNPTTLEARMKKLGIERVRREA